MGYLLVLTSILPSYTGLSVCCSLVCTTLKQAPSYLTSEIWSGWKWSGWKGEPRIYSSLIMRFAVWFSPWACGVLGKLYSPRMPPEEGTHKPLLNILYHKSELTWCYIIIYYYQWKTFSSSSDPKICFIAFTTNPWDFSWCPESWQSNPIYHTIIGSSIFWEGGNNYIFI